MIEEYNNLINSISKVELEKLWKDFPEYISDDNLSNLQNINLYQKHWQQCVLTILNNKSNGK